MSFAALRASARRTTASAVRVSPRVAVRNAALRRYATESAPPPPPKSSNVVLFGALGAAALATGAFFVFSSSDEATKDSSKSGIHAANYVPTKEDYQKVYNRVAEIFDKAADKNYDDGSYGPIILRLAWHSSGTYDKDTKTGGSNYATMRFDPESKHGANNGLIVARDLLEPIKQEFPWISYGDLWTLGGVAAIQELGGPKVPWRPGRVDGVAAQCTPDGRLPDASQGSDHVRNIFYRMGFNDQEIVALLGGHALGRCHADRSGYDGPWTFSPTSVTNSFYKLLLEEKWVWKKWGGPKQLEDKKTQSLMMLPADYVLVTDKNFKKWVKAYADDNLWTSFLPCSNPDDFDFCCAPPGQDMGRDPSPAQGGCIKTSGGGFFGLAIFLKRAFCHTKLLLLDSS